MDTDRLIESLKADIRRPPMPLETVTLAGLVLAVLAAGGLFTVLLDVRPDFSAAVSTLRFPVKFVQTISLAVAAFVLWRDLLRPEASSASAVWLSIAPACVAIAVVLELLAVPAGAWPERLVGSNSLVCLAYIPVMGLGPLAIAIAVSRHGAPTRRTWAGAAAGLLAGGIAATFYATHCTDDSPLFVAVWYTLAIAVLAIVGAVAARLVVRW